MYTRYNRIHERDRHPDGQTKGHHTTVNAMLMHSIMRQKLQGSKFYLHNKVVS